MSNLAVQRMSPPDYLAFERKSEIKHEFFDGQVFAMAGASLTHVTICTNILVAATHQLDPKRCRALGFDMRVKVEQTGLYTYPDAVILCDGPRLEDSFGDTLLNPMVVFEVLSPSTEKYDRGHKSEHYRRVPSLTDYFLVSQHRAHVEHFRRSEGGEWILKEYHGLDRPIDISSISATLTMAEIYQSVQFGEPEPLREATE